MFSAKIHVDTLCHCKTASFPINFFLFITYPPSPVHHQKLRWIDLNIQWSPPSAGPLFFPFTAHSYIATLSQSENTSPEWCQWITIQGEDIVTLMPWMTDNPLEQSYGPGFILRPFQDDIQWAFSVGSSMVWFQSENVPKIRKISKVWMRLGRKIEPFPEKDTHPNLQNFV